MIQKIKYIFERVENILEKGENAGYQDFLLFQKCFQKPPSSEFVCKRVKRKNND